LSLHTEAIASFIKSKAGLVFEGCRLFSFLDCGLSKSVIVQWKKAMALSTGNL
jgi:hypothetical protein